MKKGIQFAVISSILLSGCALDSKINGMIGGLNNLLTTAKLPVTYMRPANQDNTDKIKRIAVITDRSSSNAVNLIESNLSAIRVNDKPYFTFVDQAALDKVIAQQRFNEGDLTNSNNRTRLGKLTGADTLVTALYGSDVETSTYYEERSECVEKGDKWYKCKRSRDVKVRCSEKLAKVILEPKAISVESGEIIFTKRYSQQVSSKVCEGDDPHNSDSALLGQAVSQISEELIQDVAPHSVTKLVELMESDDSDMSDDAEKMLDMGIEFAEKDMPDNACKMFSRAQSIYSESLAINYNNAVCAERAADLELALAYYQKSHNLTMDVDELKYIIEGEQRLLDCNKHNAKLAQNNNHNRL